MAISKIKVFINDYPALFYLIFAFTCFFIFSRIDYRIYKNFFFFFYFIAILLLLTTLIFGQLTKGAVRWLDLGFVSLQASELAKPLLILAAVNLGLKLKLQKIKNAVFFFLIFLPLLFLLFKQPDLGNMIIYLIIFLGVFYHLPRF